MHIPNPYTDPTFAAQMAMAMPFPAYAMLPAYATMTAAIARASMLPPVLAATAWNLALLSAFTGDTCTCGKANKPA
jgi:hypothetical protein